MKHNGVVTRILKTSSAASGTSAGSAAKARPVVVAVTPPVLPRDKDVDNIVAGISDVAAEAGQTPPFASSMEREIAALLSRGGSKARGPVVETPIVPRPAPVIAQAPVTAKDGSLKEGDRVTVRAPGHDAEAVSSDGPIQVPPPPRAPAEMRDAVTARPPGRPPPLPTRMDIVPAKPTGEPVRVQVKPPPLPLPLGTRRDVHVDVIDAPAETRREPCARPQREPPVEFWADTSLVESVPPSDPNESLPQRRNNGAQRGSFALAGQAIVLYGSEPEDPMSGPSRPAMPPALPPGPAPQCVPAKAAPQAPHPPSPPPTAWVQQPSPPPPKPLRARLQAAALGIAAGVAISMVVTWRPPSQPVSSSYGPGAAPEGAAAMMTPSRPAAKPSALPISVAPSADSIAPPAAETAALLGATKDTRSRVTPPASAQSQATPPVSAAAVSPVHAPQASARASAAAPEPPVVKAPSLSGRVAGDDE